MERRDSSNSDTLKLETLIRDYVNNTNSNAGVELSNMTNISGNILIDTLNNLGLETEKEMEEYKKAKYDYNETVKNYTKLEENYNKLKEENELLKKDSENYQGIMKGIEPIIIQKVKEILKKANQK